MGWRGSGADDMCSRVGNFYTARKGFASMTGLKTLKIAIIAPCWFEVPPLAYGGIEWICAWLADGLVARGHDVTLLASGTAKTKAKFLQTYKEPPSKQLGQPVPEVIQAAASARLTENMEFDVIHDHTLAGPLLARSRTAPTVVTAHGPVCGEIGHLFRLLPPEVGFVAISAAQRADAPDLNWAGTVHNGIPVSDYPFGRQKQDYLLFLGRMSPEKGAALAIDCAEEAGLPVILAGKSTEPAELSYFESEIRPRLNERVRWIGEAGPQQKKDLLMKARCLIFPIQWKEPFGIVMVEALACGTPVVALKDGSVPEVVLHEQTGFVFEDPVDLVEGIRLANRIDPAACRKRAEELFDTSVMVEGYESVYRTVTAT